MPAVSTLSKAIQDAIVAKLVTLSGLVGVSVIGRRRSVLSNDIQSGLSKLGVCLYVFPALPVQVNPNLPGPYVDRMEMRVRVIEMPDFNKSLPDAYELAELVLRGLHEWTPSGIAGINPLQCLAAPIEDVPDEEALIFDVKFQTSVGLPTG